MKYVSVCVGTAAALIAASGASAANSFLSQWNLIVGGNLTNSSEVQGSAIIGGNLSGTSNYSTQLVTAPGNTGLAVGGNITSGNMQINSGGNFRIAGANTGGGNINRNGGGAYINDPTVTSTISSLMNQARSTQTYYAGLIANSTFNSNGNQGTFNSTPSMIGSDNVAVFSINASQVANLGDSVNINLGSATSIIINVNGQGAAVDFSSPPNMVGNFNQSNSSKIVWNFLNTPTLTINNNFSGAVLAPDTHLNLTGGGINGTVVVASMTMNSVVRRNLYVGHIPAPGASVALVLAGAGLAIRRRR